jgi:ketosteroid isomerase-like protein
MSQENVEIVRKAFDAFARGGIDPALPFFHPGIEWTSDAYAFEPQTYSGHDGMRRYAQRLVEDFDDFRNEPEEIHRCR